MEKDIGRIAKNAMTDIIVRIDEFGGKPGVTVREFVTGKDGGYSGFTKSGTRIPADKFLEFRELINSVKLEELNAMTASNAAGSEPKEKKAKKEDTSVEDY